MAEAYLSGQISYQYIIAKKLPDLRIKYSSRQLT